MLDRKAKLYNITNSKSEYKLKRILDISFSLIILIMLSPTLLIISLLIKITSQGEVIYSQDRITKDEKVFKIYKFRTMKVDAEKYTGPIFADNDDIRCTKIGNILRKISFDELPQLFNVLKGDMSIVGPRPERPFYVDKFKFEIDNYYKRHKVKSGLTGLAQIKGLRGKTSIEQRLEYDLEYINHYNLKTDIKIIYLTIIIIFKDIFSYLFKNNSNE